MLIVALVVAPFAVILILFLIALLRCERTDTTSRIARPVRGGWY